MYRAETSLKARTPWSGQLNVISDNALFMQLPHLELLKASHKFPGDYTFKVIGKADNGFLGRTLAAARAAAKLEKDPEFTVRQSAGGKHVAVTLQVPTESAESVIEIYKVLGKLDGLQMLM